MRSDASAKGTLRCAIYTRKSSEEGLEQDFNSLDAQREACEAFIISQKHEGWCVLEEMYDDGGLSGGTMDRPALKRLLSDIEAGKVDSVIVYKVDRLSRSLSDFVKIVEVFDQKGVSFVSVTQQFNTTSSMGRLTLNMLLSFAQFEREVTSERIRDKIAASKRKGLWMGGLPPLGYDARERRLVINDAEATTVRHIYQRYVELGSVRLLKDDLERDRIVSKQRVNKHGRISGGKPIARGALYLMLSNRLYLGEIVHKDRSYPGEHEPIISQQLWDDVQALLSANRTARKSGAHARSPSLLAGLVFDDNGGRMSPSHASKNGKSYRYYVSRSLIANTAKQNMKGMRIPAGDLEGLVERRIVQLFKAQLELHQILEPQIPDPLDRQPLWEDAARLAAKWQRLGASTRRRILTTLIARIDIHQTAVELRLDLQNLPAVLSDKEAPACTVKDGETFTITVPAKLRRAGQELKLVIEGRCSSDKPDPHLLRLLGKAFEFQAIFLRGGQSIADMASEAGVSSSYFTRALRLSFLSPDIIKAIIAGRQPVHLTARRLKSYSAIPVIWSQQADLLERA